MAKINFNALIVGILLIGTLLTINTYGITFGTRSDVGFQDGLSDFQTGISGAINGHGNTRHHSAAYMNAYQRGLSRCGSSGGGSSQPSSGQTDCTGAKVLVGALGADVGSIVGPEWIVGGAASGAQLGSTLCNL